jgi:four helix bundle protein
MGCAVSLPAVPPPLVMRGGGSRPLSTCAPASDAAPLLDAERLDVYTVALEFQVQTSALASPCDAIVRDQLRRASLSIVLNIAEGAGQRSRAQKRHLYGIARGSAMECAAIVDVLRLRAIAEPAECRRARALLVRIVQMLTKLDRSLESGSSLPFTPAAPDAAAAMRCADP